MEENSISKCVGEERITSDEEIMSILEALVDVSDDFSPNAQIVYSYQGKTHTFSWKNFPGNLNLFNALSSIWGMYQILQPSDEILKKGMTLLAVLKNILNIADIELKDQDAFILYYAKKCGASNCWIEEETILEQMLLDKEQNLPTDRTIQELLKSITKESFAESITNLTKMKVIDELGGKIKICEKILPGTLDVYHHE